MVDWEYLIIVLKENTNFDEETIEKFYLCFLQDSVDGKMSKEEFSSKFQNSFCSGRSNEDFSSHLFDALDTDQNGYIDFKEFLLAIDITSAGSPQEKLNWAFRYLQVSHIKRCKSSIGSIY